MLDDITGQTLHLSRRLSAAMPHPTSTPTATPAPRSSSITRAIMNGIRRPNTLMPPSASWVRSISIPHMYGNEIKIVIRLRNQCPSNASQPSSGGAPIFLVAEEQTYSRRIRHLSPAAPVTNAFLPRRSRQVVKAVTPRLQRLRYWRRRHGCGARRRYGFRARKPFGKRSFA